MSGEEETGDARRLFEALADEVKDPKSRKLSETLKQLEAALGLVLANEELRNGKTSPKWVENLRMGLRIRLQTRGLNVEDRCSCLCVCSQLLGCFGRGFLGSDPSFLPVLSALSGLELRILLDAHPQKVLERPHLLICCCTLMESCLELIEDESVPEEAASKASRSCKETVQFLMEYLLEAHRQNIQIPFGVLYPLFRVICAFLARGGHQIIPENVLRPSLDILIQTAIEAKNLNSEFDACSLLIPALEQIPESILPASAVSIRNGNGE